MMSKFSCFDLRGTSVLRLRHTPTRARSQTSPNFEVGAHLTTLDLRESIGEKPGGVGARFTYNVDEHFAFDSEINYFPEDADTWARRGALRHQAGKRFSDKVGRLRQSTPRLSSPRRCVTARNPAAEQTQVRARRRRRREFYPSERFAIRIDVGDTIIPFGNDVIDRAALPDRASSAPARRTTCKRASVPDRF